MPKQNLNKKKKALAQNKDMSYNVGVELVTI